MRRHRIASLLCSPLLLAIGCDQAAGVDPDPASQAEAAVQVVAETPDASAEDDGMLTIGSAAPPLDVEHWYPTKLANDQPITKLGDGGVTIVEFWATWCGPCVASIPHINDLQEQYAERGVTFTSITREPTDTVEPFFQRTVRGESGDDAPTYQDLMSAYRVGSDPDGSTNAAYMEAAGQSGIPCAFIVGKTGLVEWIGHPMAMDPVLEEVVEGTWDREAFGKEFRMKQRVEKMMQEMSMALRRGNTDEAYRLLDRLAAESDSPQVQAQVAAMRESLDLQVFYMSLGRSPEKDLEEVRTRIASYDGNIEQINRFVWPLAAINAQGGNVAPELLQLAAKLTGEALATVETPEEGNVLDTIAHLQYESGDLEQALQTQAKAAGLDNPPQLQASIDQFLSQLKAEQEAASESQDPIENEKPAEAAAE